MPAPVKNINAFDLKLLQALLNLKLNKNYALELTTYDRQRLCVSYNKEGPLSISHNYLFKIWSAKHGINQNVSLSTLDKLCGLLKKDYRWRDFITDISPFRPSGIPYDKPYSYLKPEQIKKVDKTIKEIFQRFRNFEEFESEVINKSITVFTENKNKNSNLQSLRNDDAIITFVKKIYIELLTRKAAIPIDENNDVIEEIYNSWYKLFCVIREEMKSLPAQYLVTPNKSPQVIGLTLEILNNTLRAHLTEHQAKFRTWLQQAKSKRTNQNFSPQLLQKKYPDYKTLILSIKQVNEMLVNFSKELYNFIEEEQ
jgi:hypothetical protein